MKVLFISTLYPPHVIGGAEKAASQLAEALVRSGHEVAVVSLYPGANEIIEDRNGVRVYRLPIDNFYWPFGRKQKPKALFRLAWHIRDMWNHKAAERVGRILDIESPDAVHTHCIAGFSLSVWGEVKKRKLRLVHTLYDYYLLCSRSSLFRNGSNCEQRCLDCALLTSSKRRLSHLPDSIISVSRHTLDAHLRNHCFAGRRTTVIYNISDLARIADQQRSGVDRDADNLVFGFIGKIEEAKGIETLLSATTRLRLPNWKLRIAGTGLEGYVQGLSKRFADPRITWLGFTDAAEFYSSVDVVVIPSMWADPLPLVCVEGLHTGKALICAESGGIPEIARLAEVAEFFPAGDANALAEKMNLALMSPQRWREGGVRSPSALDAFKEDHVVEKYLAEYAFRSEEVPSSAHGGTN
jgi:glycosyltransferase involved in cell wall biosynthesis